ncbi:hypothetical protein TPL01_27160 [Sulfuriferula plumbiphila]|uniref:Uncharacterized protein n=1 Tax=Sulfuriferula plumbiphila TaxID=171865 RepID=A0A512LAS1_9PROT|nr:DUF2173 family protein [Sulfuriferula plumbiphila]BBP03340.1 hypothetical protein SFPGR_07620 [Sulfuriferula plumbiphila]GEP31578.1 hypothetical protein TPL01_27160 [Sulfuriferula plumbiphila]
MIDLENLLVIKGVVAAFRFNDDGSLAESVGELDQENASLAAQLCYANGRISHQSSNVLMTISGMAGWPPRGWMMLGDALSICTIANVVCFVSNAGVSFNEVVHVLSEVGHE